MRFNEKRICPVCKKREIDLKLGKCWTCKSKEMASNEYMGQRRIKDD